MHDDGLVEEASGLGQDQRAELMLGALVCVVVALLLAMLVFVFHEAWPSFGHNGLGWFGSGGNVDGQIQAIFTSGELNQAAVYAIHAWPLIWSTILITGASVTIGFVGALFVAVFMVEFAPAPCVGCSSRWFVCWRACPRSSMACSGCWSSCPSSATT